MIYLVFFLSLGVFVFLFCFVGCVYFVLVWFGFARKIHRKRKIKTDKRREAEERQRKRRNRRQTEGFLINVLFRLLAWLLPALSPRMPKTAGTKQGFFHIYCVFFVLFVWLSGGSVATPTTTITTNTKQPKRIQNNKNIQKPNTNQTTEGRVRIMKNAD